MGKWYVHQDREEEDESIDSYTITCDPEKPGWNTDSGYYGYGLPKELAQWICDRLNDTGVDCSYTQNILGHWKKKNERMD